MYILIHLAFSADKAQQIIKTMHLFQPSIHGIFITEEV